MITSSILDRFWVKPSGVHKTAYLVPKNGACSLESLFPEKVAQDKEKLCAFMEDAKKNGTAVHLTKEQISQLSERFDPNDMTYEDYHTFVNQLCDWDVLRWEDAQYVSVGPQMGGLDLIPVDFAEPMGKITPLKNYQHFDSCFSSSSGNALEWTRYLASFEDFNPDTGSFERGRSAILFGKLRDVLEMMR